MIRRNNEAAPFVTCGDQLEQDGSLSLILSHVAEVFEDEQVVFVEFLDRAFQRQSLTSLLQALHEICGPREQDPVAVLDESMTEGGAEMRLARPGWAEQQDRATSVDPSVAGPAFGWRHANVPECEGGEGDNVRSTEHWHGGEVETVE